MTLLRERSLGQDVHIQALPSSAHPPQLPSASLSGWRIRTIRSALSRSSRSCAPSLSFAEQPQLDRRRNSALWWRGTEELDIGRLFLWRTRQVGPWQSYGAWQVVQQPLRQRALAARRQAVLGLSSLERRHLSWCQAGAGRTAHTYSGASCDAPSRARPNAARTARC
jgi:hypothetical protein